MNEKELGTRYQRNAASVNRFSLRSTWRIAGLKVDERAEDLS